MKINSFYTCLGPKMTELKISDKKLSNLMEEIKKNKNLAEKLGLLEENETQKRKAPSPLKVKKVKVTNTEMGSTSTVPLENEAERVRSSNIDDSNLQPGSSKACSLESTGEEVGSSYSSDSDCSDDLDNLERLIQTNENEGSESEEDFKMLGDEGSPTWSPNSKSFKFFQKASDVELSKEILNNIKKKYEGKEEIENEFRPPKFPSAMWDSVQTNGSDVYRLKALFKVQENLYLSIKPLLDLLSTAEGEAKEKLIESIQLICSSNLQLSRFRRATIAPHLKPELRKQILSLPITHNAFFGEDFNRTTDNLIKEHTAFEKII